jgi:rod shape-determining protein MreC
MQQIIILFLKNSYKLLFLLLLGIGLSLTIMSHSYHRSEYINSANAFSGGVYKKVNEGQDYLKLKNTNLKLAEENAYLKQLLFNKPDTLIKIDSIKQANQLSTNYTFKAAKVIKNSFNVRQNYITIDKGNSDNIKPDMGVVNENGIVGIIEKTSKNYATVISILNTKTKIHAKLKNSPHFGSINWDGKNVGYIQLIDIPRLAKLKKGDSIVTGSDSRIFPENIPIGKVDRVYIDKKTNYYTINIRLFNDMTALNYVYVIESQKKKEIQQLEGLE